MAANGSALFCYAMIIFIQPDTSGEIRYSSLPKNTNTQWENPKRNTKNTTDINWK